jgi:hypothetical protein
MQEGGRIIATVTDYDGFTAALRKWIYELDTTYECVNDLAGLQSNYLVKLISRTPVRGFSRMSLSSTLGALCLRLQIVVDTEKLAKMKPRYVPRRKHACDDACNENRRSLRFNANLAQIFAHRRALILPPARRKAIAQIAARARWRSEGGSPTS